MKSLLLAAAVLAASTVVASAQQPIGGTYTVEGTNPNGSPYSGTAQIVGVTDSTCEITWTTGNSTSSGICMRYGIAFSAFYAIDNGVFGLLIYEVLDNGVLQGIWTVTGQDGVGTEILTPQ